METISQHACFDGIQGFYRHDSQAIGLPMRFAVYQPPQARTEALPVLFYLAGLTCTEETFMIKAGAQRYAAEHGIMLVSCDTSPRGAGVPGEEAEEDLGTGAGFYLNATQEPWARNYRMYDYVLQDLRETVLENFPADPGRIGIFGHSMGGHGALVLALRNPHVYRSVSALAPIVAPSQSPWGQKAFRNYLGENKDEWSAYDATELMKKTAGRFPEGILIDQGTSDKFLNRQLFPERFEEACRLVGQPLTLRRREGYDHGYYFIASYIESHLAFHALRFRA
ncbi:MAG TPA: S-formylglutathione hydrolase [bacterium]|nr:S-formylglutathione hydrolase [bacterium]